MIHTANTKKVLLINDSGVTNGETVTGYVDTKGYDSVSIDVILTTSNDVTNNPSTLKLGEGDTTSSFDDITAFVGDTAFTIPNCLTAATQITGPFATFNVDCRARKRYLQVTATPITTQGVTVLAQLGRPEQSPVSASEVNATVVVNG